MKDLILFSIDKNHFALELDKIKRIVQASPTTPVAGNADEIEGVFTFEKNVLNVLDFRTMIGVNVYNSRYDKLFSALKQGHESWVEELKSSVEEERGFSGELSPFDCDLGKWLSSFNAYDDTVTGIIDRLSVVHNKFHGQASPVINEAKGCKSCAQEMINSNIEPLKHSLLGLLDELHADKQLIANSMQKFLILDAEKPFAVRIDEIDDIIAVSESDIQASETFEGDESLVKIDGIFEYKEKLVNLIERIKMPQTKDL